MEIQFIGCGSAFSTSAYYQTNALVIADSGKRLLIDCGSDARFALAELSLNPTDIDAVYISHLHADHVGGMEWLAFCTFFAPDVPRPKLYCNEALMHELWEQSLRGGLESIQGQVMTLTGYFDCHPVPENGEFVWENIRFTPVQTVHIMSGYTIKYSYGLLIQDLAGTSTVFFTSDTQFCPNQIREFYTRAHLIFQDCETSPYKSGVHAHYDELEALPREIKKKMWLCHYQPDPPQSADGFAGFVKKGQIFEITNEALLGG